MTKLISVLAAMPLLCSFLMAAHSCEKGTLNPAAAHAKEVEATLSCSMDADCSLVNADCCGCRQGGKQTAISTAAVAAWQGKLAAQCKETFCAQVISRDPSCQQKAQCVEGLCQLR